MKKDMTDIFQIFMDEVNWDKKRAQKWLDTINHLPGGATPNGNELMKGKERREKFIRKRRKKRTK